MNDLMIFEGHEVEVFEFNGQALFNPYHIGECLELAESSVRNYLARMNKKQAIQLKNSDVRDMDIRKLNNAGEKFLTESGVYKLVFKSHKPNAEVFTDWVTDEVLPALRKTGSYEMPKQKDSAKRLPLPSVNMMVRNITGALEKAKVEPIYIAAEIKRLYTDAGYPVNAPLITDKLDMPKLYDNTEMARELGVLSTSGNPHSQAIGAILKKLHIPESEIVTTAFSRNGHNDVTIQYKPSVFEDVKAWLMENGYPTKISYMDSKGKLKTCTVVYREVA